MKKLMIALAAAALAVGSQAATINWKSGTNVLGPDGTTKLGKNAYTMYVWDTLTAETYAGLTLDKVISDYASQTDSAKSASSGSATLGTTVKNTAAADDTTYYAAVLLKYVDGDKTYYLANLATAHTDAVGGGATVNNLGKVVGGGSSTTATTWSTAAVPEPTSGLLLLLGMAGLALKRKIA